MVVFLEVFDFPGFQSCRIYVPCKVNLFAFSGKGTSLTSVWIEHVLLNLELGVASNTCFLLQDS